MSITWTRYFPDGRTYGFRAEQHGRQEVLTYWACSRQGLSLPEMNAQAVEIDKNKFYATNG